ncbi:hypothetical protein TNCV_3781941 [Trichonephila clavipes]|nr:hypothetical protein TNCV_3781941 [Trichonephila clavipes]
METKGACAANCVMNGGHRKRNGRTMCLLTNPFSACNITMVGFEFGDTEIKLLSWLLVLSIYHQSKTWGSMLPETGPEYTTRCYTRSTLAKCGSRMDCCTLGIHPKFLRLYAKA